LLRLKLKLSGYDTRTIHGPNQKDAPPILPPLVRVNRALAKQVISMPVLAQLNARVANNLAIYTI
jgi:hypothetical protein